MSIYALKIGVLANSSEQVGEFVRIVQAAGYRASATIDASQALLDYVPDVDVWFASPGYSKEVADLLDLFDKKDTPIVFDDESFDGSIKELSSTELREKRARRLGIKLEGFAHGHVLDRASRFQRAKHLWVLAASTGGPKAISDFLDGVPASLDNVALLYVQHISDDTMQTLKQVVDKHSQFSVCLVDAPRVIREKTLYMIPPSMQIELRDDGIIAPVDKPWEGDYAPSIDQVIAKVARVFAERGGAIIFTGMGDDGARSSKLLHHRGGQVWAQQAESCAVDSMPVSVESFTQPNVSGTPEQLARQFVAHFTAAPSLVTSHH